MRLCISSEVQILQVDHQGFVARFPIIGMEHLTNPIDVFSQAGEYLHIILRVHDANDDMKFVVENKESFALRDLHESTLLMELPQDFPSGSYRLRFELFDTITSPFVGDSILSMHEVYWQKPPLQSSGSGRTQFIAPWKMTYASSNPKLIGMFHKVRMGIDNGPSQSLGVFPRGKALEGHNSCRKERRDWGATVTRGQARGDPWRSPRISWGLQRPVPRGAWRLS